MPTEVISSDVQSEQVFLRMGCARACVSLSSVANPSVSFMHMAACVQSRSLDQHTFCEASGQEPNH